jgi:hypothetical protein
MRERKKRIGNETESMKFMQLKMYFDRMNVRFNHLYLQLHLINEHLSSQCVLIINRFLIEPLLL